MFQHKISPFNHQRAEFDAHWAEPRRAILWEQGTGKTKLTLDTAAQMYLEGKVDGLFVIAPEGVHRNWVMDEVPTHMTESVSRETLSVIWDTKRSGTRAMQSQLRTLLAHKGLAVFAMSYDAIMTERRASDPRGWLRGAEAAREFLTKRKCLYVLDESPRVKNPKAKRTIRVLASSKYATYRRILTGTPVDNSPFDLYSQLKFLDPGIWHEMGLGNFTTFKAYFGVWVKNQTRDGKEYPHCVAYQNLHRLKEVLDKVGTRVTKDQVLDLPPKLYKKRYVELSSEQQRIYDELRTDYLTELASGEVVSAPLAIVRLMRLQQVICGYVPSDDGDGELLAIAGGNPRLEALVEDLNDLPHKAIVWCRFQKDIDLVAEALGHEATWCDGRVTGQDRTDALRSFQEGGKQFLIANPAAVGEGYTLHAAKTVVYYSNSFKLKDRLQSEDRAHRIGLQHPVEYVDYVSVGTVDQHIVRSLRNKLDVASKITGDELRSWL